MIHAIKTVFALLVTVFLLYFVVTWFAIPTWLWGGALVVTVIGVLLTYDTEVTGE